MGGFGAGGWKAAAPFLEAAVDAEGEARAVEDRVLHLGADAAVEGLGLVGEIGGVERELKVGANLIRDPAFTVAYWKR